MTERRREIAVLALGLVGNLGVAYFAILMAMGCLSFRDVDSFRDGIDNFIWAIVDFDIHESWDMALLGCLPGVIGVVALVARALLIRRALR